VRTISKARLKIYAATGRAAEPFDYEEVWKLLSPEDRAEIPMIDVRGAVHMWSHRGQLVRVAGGRPGGVKGKSNRAKYRRTAGFADVTKKYFLRTQRMRKGPALSALEQAWRELRAGMELSVPDLSTYSLGRGCD
jgi:hypothetical protein